MGEGLAKGDAGGSIGSGVARSVNSLAYAFGIGGNELVGCLPPTGGKSPAGELFGPSIGAYEGGKLLTLDKAGGSARVRESCG